MKTLPLFLLILLPIGLLDGPARHTADRAAVQDTLFADDFSTPSDRWNTGEWTFGSGRYEAGTMRIHANGGSSHGSTTITYDRVFTDHIIEVDVVLAAGSDDNWQTVTCRHTEGGNYYDLGISADGYYLIDVWVNHRKLRTSLGPTRSRHIRLGPGVVNRLRVECVGTTLRLSVNGRALADLTDTNHSRGEIGLSVDALAARFSEVAFDNLVVTAP